MSTLIKISCAWLCTSSKCYPSNTHLQNLSSHVHVIIFIILETLLQMNWFSWFALLCHGIHLLSISLRPVIYESAALMTQVNNVAAYVSRYCVVRTAIHSGKYRSPITTITFVIDIQRRTCLMTNDYMKKVNEILVRSSNHICSFNSMFAFDALAL